MAIIGCKLLETLEELGSGDLEKFKHALLHTKMKEGLPKIPKDQVETADKDEIVKLMVEIYGQRCVEVTEDILEMMNRTDLVGKLSERSSVSKGKATTLPAEILAKYEKSLLNILFVFYILLTDRVSHMDPILDRLLDRGVLQREAYDTIRALPTSQKKMRELYCGCLQAGAASKDIFYQILLENEKFLIDDLNTKH
uniref:CARD domain-containing protein n=1 Tax=Labrus bergylta TaxID=56723 RepID=A0A3Q3G9D1_9LABR